MAGAGGSNGYVTGNKHGDARTAQAVAYRKSRTDTSRVESPEGFGPGVRNKRYARTYNER